MTEGGQDLDWQLEGVGILKSYLYGEWYGCRVDPYKLAELYDQYGLPLDLMFVECRERGLTIDSEHFESVLKRIIAWRQGRIRKGKYIDV